MESKTSAHNCLKFPVPKILAAPVEVTATVVNLRVKKRGKRNPNRRWVELNRPRVSTEKEKERAYERRGCSQLANGKGYV